jgi:hypothetical protein
MWKTGAKNGSPINMCTRGHLDNPIHPSIIFAGPYSQHFIFFVTYELTQEARVFAPEAFPDFCNVTL